MKIPELIKKHLPDLKIDTELIDRIQRYRIGIFSKNNEVIEFMSSNLMGVHRIRMSDSDIEEFFIMFDVDKQELAKDITKLKGIKKEWKVATNPFNMLCAILLHLIATSNIKEDQKSVGEEEVFYIMAYRFLTSYYSVAFAVPLDPDLAKTVYEHLNNKSLIKRTGSNFEVFRHKSYIVKRESKLYKKILRFNTYDAKDVISAISGTIKGYTISQYKVLMEIKEEASAIHNKSLISDGEDGEYMVDVENKNYEYYNILRRIVMIDSELYHPKLIQLIDDLFPRTDIESVKKVIHSLPDYVLTNPSHMEAILSKIVSANIEYLYVTKMYPPYDKSVTPMLKHLKNYWSSSKVKEPKVKEVKEELYRITKEVTGKNTRWVVVSTSIIVIIYLFVRTVLDKKINKGL